MARAGPEAPIEACAAMFLVLELILKLDEWVRKLHSDGAWVSFDRAAKLAVRGIGDIIAKSSSSGGWPGNEPR